MARAVCSGAGMSRDPGRSASPRPIFAAALGTLPAALLGIVFALVPVCARAEAPGSSDPSAAAPAVAATVRGTDPAEPALATGAASAAPAPGTTRFKLTPEQQETLRLARESEARTLLGLDPDAPIPAEIDLTDAQRATIRAAREAEMRRVLGLAPGDPIPDRSRVTAEQRQKIEVAHEARIRAALGLAADVPLEREPIPLPTSTPASPATADPEAAAAAAPAAGAPAVPGAPQ